MSGANVLFSEFELGPSKLKNRIIMAPMTRNRAAEGNVPYELNAKYYVQRASAGLIITEGAQVSERGVGYPGTPGIHSKEQVKGWKLVTDAVHRAGGLIFLQLWHVGRISHPSLQPGGDLPVAPSAIKPAGQAFTFEGLQDFVTPRELQTGEIPGIVEEFRKGAENALSAGFDGVEIHGANGYLIDQFLRDGSNLRTDVYGGSLANRARFALEVAGAVAGIYGADRVGFRISPLNSFNDMSDSEPEKTFTYIAAELGKMGLAYLHVVEATIGPDGVLHQEFGYKRLREEFGGAYIANGGYTKERAEQAIDSRSADLVSFGSLFLANPDLVERLKMGGPYTAPNPDTFYGGAEEGYTDYPEF